MTNARSLDPPHPTARRDHVLLIRPADPQIGAGLIAHGFRVSTRERVADLDHDLPVDAALLSVGVPAVVTDALAEIEAVRPGLPVIVVGLTPDPDGTIRCLDAGADDYVTWPVRIDELAARIRTRVRGSGRVPGVMEVGSTRLDLVGHRAIHEGREADLSIREVELLATLLGSGGEVVSRRHLLRTVWRLEHDPRSNLVSVYVASLRRKLGAGSIETVRGRGYRFRSSPGIA